MSRKNNTFIHIDDYYKIELYKSNTNIVIDYAYISEEDYDICKDYFWYKTEYGYARAYINGKFILLHKYITHTDDTVLLDHKDRNKLNCRRNNLRIANKSINSINRDVQSNSITGFTGISYDKRKNKYRAYIKVKGKQIFLGYHQDINNAISARQKGELRYFGYIKTIAADEVHA